MTNKTYYDFANPYVLRKEYPFGEEFTETFSGMSRDELHHIQNERFASALDQAAKVPFYKNLWKKHGVSRGDVRGLEDIKLLPTFGKAEIMESVAAMPPLGLHSVIEDPDSKAHYPIILHTTSGTTGEPQPLIYSPRTREVQSLLLARAYHQFGIGSNDVVQSFYGFGPINGGHYIREAFTKYNPAIFLPTGTGVETPTEKQIEYMKRFGTTVLTGFGDYVARVGRYARSNNEGLAKDINIRMLVGHFGFDSYDVLRELWGSEVEIFDWYGVGDTGIVGWEGKEHNGLHIMEDAQYVEIEAESEEQDDKGSGNIVVTCLYINDVFPIIRFNTHDVSCVLPPDNIDGYPFRRLGGIGGRSDDMVKFKGINIYPQSIGNIIEKTDDYAGNYLCEWVRLDDGKQDLIIYIESSLKDSDGVRENYEAILKKSLGVTPRVRLVAKHGLDDLTGINVRQKPRRLIKSSKPALGAPL